MDARKRKTVEVSGNKHSSKGIERVVKLTMGRKEIQMVNKVTRPKAAKAASKVLRDGRTGTASKTAAGSALSQVPKQRAPVKRGKK